MMERGSPEKFANLLTSAVQRIKIIEVKNLSVIQDELGQALGKTGGDSIRRWRKGYIPSKLTDLESLTRLLHERKGLENRAEFEQFLRYGGHPHPQGVWEELLGGTTSKDPTTIPYTPLVRPPKVDPFMTRDPELKELLDSLKPRQVVTLTGPGGVGKTSLAIEAIWQLTPDDELPERFPDGIIFHRFHNQPQLDLALENIIRSFGEKPNQGSLRDTVERVLSKRIALLVLDGAEEAENLQSLLNLRCECGVLITSRSLTEHPSHSRISISTLDDNDAIKLLRVWTKPWTVDENTAQAIYELIGGLPLAARLAGSFLKATHMPGEEYVALLRETPFKAFADGDSEQKSVEGVIETSLSRVSKKAQQALAIVGMLAQDSFDRKVIAAAMQVASSQAGLLLAELKNFSLLDQKNDRYQASHILIHTYAQKQLVADPEAFDRLVDYYIDLAKTESHNGLKGYHQLNNNRTHLLQLLNHCADRKDWVRTQYLIWAVNDYLIMQGHWTELRTALEIGIKAARATSHLYNIRAFLNSLGTTCLNLGQTKQAIHYCQQALSIAQETSYRPSESVALTTLGVICLNLGQTKQAIHYYQQALAIAQEFGDRQHEAAALCNLGNSHRHLGQTKQAIHYYQQALAIAQEINDRRSEAISLNTLGEICLNQGQLEQAFDYCQQALSIAQEIGDRQGKVAALITLGTVYCDQGQLEQAFDYCQQALAIAQEIDDRRGKVAASITLGIIYRDQGQLEQAFDYCQQALAIAQEIDDRRHEAISLKNLGIIHHDREQYAQALDCHKQALTINRDVGNRQSEVTSLSNLGIVYDSSGKIEQALENFQQALSIAQEIGDRSNEVIMLEHLGVVHNNSGKIEQALENFQQALSIAQEIGDRSNEAFCLSALETAYNNLGKTK